MPKITIIAIIVLVTISIGFMMVHRDLNAAHGRGAVQRLESRHVLTRLAAALQSYRTKHGVWPDSLAVAAYESHLGIAFNVVAGVGAYTYRKPPDGANPDFVVIWSQSCHAGVAAGKPWGGEGQITKVAIPPKAYILDAGLNIEELDEAQWRQRTPPPHYGSSSDHPSG